MSELPHDDAARASFDTAATAAGLARKPREVRNHHLDSMRWSAVRHRPGDIVICTWAKSGTTWMQKIVAQLIFRGAQDVPVAEISPWVELRWYPLDQMIAALEAQQHRRFMKTHLPADALVLSPQVKYVYVARDGRDAVWSLHNHHRHLTPLVYRLLNETPGLVGPPLEESVDDVVEYFREWLARDAFPYWPFWSHVRSWWDVRKLPNVLLVHYDGLKRDLPREVRRLARFLEIDVPEPLLPKIVEHCSFDYMKDTAAGLPRGLDVALKGGVDTFMHRGRSGTWRGALSSEDVIAYENPARDNLGPECARWLEAGILPEACASRSEGA